MTTAADLERLLAAHEGDAFAPDTFAGLDDREEFPRDAVRVLDEAGLPAHYVLPGDGESAGTVRLLRAVARRDLTVAIAHGRTLLGSAPVRVAGTPDQAARLAERVRGGEPVCWGLTERDHGADEGPTALFQKLLRDLAPVGFGYIARAACQMSLLPQLPLPARRTWRPYRPKTDRRPKTVTPPERHRTPYDSVRSP